MPDGDSLTIRLKDTSPFARVHVIASRYLPEYSAFADFVKVRVGQAELLEAVEKPGGSCGFAEEWCGDADQFELPLAELRLMEMQPAEGSVHGGERGEAGDAALGGRGGGHFDFLYRI